MPEGAPAQSGGGRGGAVGLAGVSTFARASFRVFGTLAYRRLPRHPGLPRKLLQAGETLVPVAYLARVYASAAVAAAVGALPLVLAALLGGPGGDVRLLGGLVVLPVVLAGMTYSYLLLKPDLAIAARRRDLEANLPYAINFMAALSSAGVVPEQLFRVLGAQGVYGQVAHEANVVYRDTALFNRDLVTALKDAARRSPSTQFREFLEGGVSTITSGGDLKSYFLGKGEQFTRDNRRKLKQFLESMGVMAESYVVVAAAAPLFLIVIVSVMMLLSGGTQPQFFLNLIVLLLLPLLHISYAAVLRNLRPD